MRVLFVSGELICGDLPYRLSQEGCDVKLYIKHPAQQKCLNGFVKHCKDWKKELNWVGKDGLIVFDDIGFGEEQDALRKAGYQVFGGSAGGDQLEIDREHGQQVLKEAGINILPVHHFTSLDKAKKFILASKPSAWVIKQVSNDSTLNYVGMLPDGQDVIDVLSSYQKMGIQEIFLQQKAEGVEIAVGRYFNGQDWVGPVCVNIEHKSLFNGDIGPKTGEMGTLMWLEDDQNQLYQVTLAKLKPYLQSIQYRGGIDLNCIVNGENVYPLEFTCRMGCPIIHLQDALMVTPWKDCLLTIAKGEVSELKYRAEYGIVISVAIPPFPYRFEGKSPLLNCSFEGIEIYFKRALSKEEMTHVHFEGVYKKLERNTHHYYVSDGMGNTMYLTGTGKDVQQAQTSVYELARQIVIPKMFYRTDIGNKFINGDMQLLQKWGWINKAPNLEPALPELV